MGVLYKIKSATAFPLLAQVWEGFCKGHVGGGGKGQGFNVLKDLEYWS